MSLKSSNFKGKAKPKTKGFSQLVRNPIVWIAAAILGGGGAGIALREQITKTFNPSTAIVSDASAVKLPEAPGVNKVSKESTNPKKPESTSKPNSVVA
jgi:hypothetical protein